VFRQGHAKHRRLIPEVFTTPSIYMQQAISENISRRWKKMSQLKRKAEEMLTSVIGQAVTERRDKTGNLHPKRVVTLNHLEEKIEAQILYYKTYK
jgi:ribosomal protein L17